MQHINSLKSVLQFWKRRFLKGIFTIYGYGGPDPKSSYLTTQLKSNYMSWNEKSNIDVAFIKNTFQTYHNNPSQS